MFKELYTSLLEGAHWHKADNYYLLLDLLPYCDAKLRVNKDYSNTVEFRRKCFINTCNAGKFSSDRLRYGTLYNRGGERPLIKYLLNNISY